MATVGLGDLGQNALEVRREVKQGWKKMYLESKGKYQQGHLFAFHKVYLKLCKMLHYPNL